MNAKKIFTATLFFIFSAAICMAQSDPSKTLGNLDLNAIKKLRILTGAKDYTMSLTTSIINKNAETLRLRNGEFEVTFDRQGGGKMLVGHTRVADQVVPGKSGETPGQADMPLSVLVGPLAQPTVDRLMEAINIIGDPAAPLRITVKGTAEVGMQLPRGWVYEQGRRFEVELVFTPAFQRDFVLK